MSIEVLVQSSYFITVMLEKPCVRRKSLSAGSGENVNKNLDRLDGEKRRTWCFPPAGLSVAGLMLQVQWALEFITLNLLRSCISWWGSLLSNKVQKSIKACPVVTEHIKFLQCRCFGSDNTGLLPLETRFSRSSTLVSDLVRTGQQVPYYRQEAGLVDTDSAVISTTSPQKFGLKN